MKLNQSRILYWSLELLILAAFVWICSQLDFVFNPIVVFVSAIIFPLVI